MPDLRVILENLITNDETEKAFGIYITLDENEVKSKIQNAIRSIEKHLLSVSSSTNNANSGGNSNSNSGGNNAGAANDQNEALFKEMLSFASKITNNVRLERIFEIFRYFIQNGLWPARMVCESILNCERLVYSNSMYWVLSFRLIRSCIRDVDYKGVREVMKGCSEKAQTLPSSMDESALTQFKVLEEVFRIIFDRDTCLLPGYFVINEIRKSHADNNAWPHWRLSHLINDMVDSFRPVAQMVSIIGHTSMLPVVEHSGYGDYSIIPWKLDPTNLRFTIKGNIPYERELLEPQVNLLRYVLEQPYSRDMVCSMLGLQKTNKNHCSVLEEGLVQLIISAMERAERKNPTEFEVNDWVWLHLSSQLIYFVLFQFALFTNIVNALHDKLVNRDLRKGRDHLMWVLLQFISGSIQRKPLDNFLPVLKLYDILYPEKEPLSLPDVNKPFCTHQMSVTCIWIHLLWKAQCDNVNLQRSIPTALKLHHEFLQHGISIGGSASSNLSMGTDFRIPLLCNAFSTNNDLLSRPMAALVDTVLGPQQQRNSPHQTANPIVPLTSSCTLPTNPTAPLSMDVLDSLTIHAKMSLIHSIVTYVIKLAQSKSNMALSAALVETYSRLLVYTEIESLGIKGFISQLLPTVFKSHAWGILYTLLEMFSYRMHHIQPHYRVQLLSHLHSLAAVPQTNQTQLHLCVESTALRLITGLGSNEVQPQLSRFLSEPKTLVSSESEELNRALVLTLARSMHITGTGTDSASGMWCKELLNTIQLNTPHSWAAHTLQCFPPFLSDYFQANSTPKDNKQQLKKAVEEEYRNWTSMTNENDIIAHFSVPGAQPLFLCLLWNMILETDRISPIAYKILERIGARALSAHLRKFCDYLVVKFAISEEGQIVNKCVDAINSMIWKYNIVTIDRLVLCLSLRTQEGNEAQLCFFIIQLLLFKGAEFRARVQEFVKENSPDHWNQCNWHEKLLAFHRKYPEKFTSSDGVLEQSSAGSGNTGGAGGVGSLPVYFGNICLRFLPVFDIVIHRYLELPPVTKSLETLLEHLGCLYKFHDRPVTYLYNTLHYYERKLHDRPQLKRRLVSAILGSFCESRGASTSWSLTDRYVKYMQMETPEWSPDLQHYINLIRRLVDTISGDIPFEGTDWRFHEFPNAASYALYMTCVEIMGLPASNEEVAQSLLNVIFIGFPAIADDKIHSWLNAIGLILSALPESYWTVLHDEIVQTMDCPRLKNWHYCVTPFELFNFNFARSVALETRYVYTLALAHATWHHAGVGQISIIPQFLREKLVPLVKSEEQFVFLCHLIGPFLSRYNVDRPGPCILELTIECFKALEQVDSCQQIMNHMDPICDFFYHIKYQYVGNLLKTEVEGLIKKLRPALQMRLRFIVHLNVNEITKCDG